MFSLKEKILREYPKARVSIQCREDLASYMKLRNPGFHVNEIPDDRCLFINGRVIADDSLAKKLPPTYRSDVVFMQGDQVVGAWLSGANLRRMTKRLPFLLRREDLEGIPVETTSVRMVSYPWDLIQRNGSELKADFDRFRRARGKGRGRTRFPASIHLIARSDILIEPGAIVQPGVVLDASDGPIYIGKNVRVFAQATIIGPVCIWDSSWVKVGSQIYENTTIGPVCKVGGEIEESIIHGYSNKQHAGFLGHAYLGTWVNLGAGTNTSDLKNNYGTVKVTMGDKQVDTGLQFVGLTMGDHSKSAINSMFNTGTVVGVCSNIFGFGFPPKYVPSFSWGAAGETFTTYGIEKAIDVARRVMARRSIELTASEAKLFRRVFELTSDERRRRGMPS
jgi:UDP-N-acetylglucosamine diphosphorylase/glucosamine-1-phosphate N-acetyltransferase